MATIRESREDVSIWKTKVCLVTTWLWHSWSFCPTLTPFRGAHTPRWALWRASRRSIRRRWPAVEMFISIQTRHEIIFCPIQHKARITEVGTTETLIQARESGSHQAELTTPTSAGLVCWPVISTLSNNELLWKWFIGDGSFCPAAGQQWDWIYPLHMSIRLSDDIPHQKAYTLFPKPLYKEMKHKPVSWERKDVNTWHI